MARPSTFEDRSAPPGALRIRPAVPHPLWKVDDLQSITLSIYIDRHGEWTWVRDDEMGWAQIAELHGKLDKLLRAKRRAERRDP